MKNEGGVGARLVPWAATHVVTQVHLQEGPELALMFCSCCLEILNNLNKDLASSFYPEPHRLVAGPISVSCLKVPQSASGRSRMQGRMSNPQIQRTSFSLGN